MFTLGYVVTPMRRALTLIGTVVAMAGVSGHTCDGQSARRARRVDADVPTIPFTSRNGFILIEGVVDTTHGTFMLDTGSPDLMLNSARLETTNIVGLAEGIGGPGGVPADIGSIEELRAGPLVARNSVAYFLDLRNLEDQLGGATPILGIIGVKQLRSYELIVDWPRHVLALIPVDSTGKRIAPTKDYVPVRRIPLREGESHHFYAHVTFRNRSMNLLVDTGSPFNFIDRSVWDSLPGPKTGPGNTDTTVTDSLEVGPLSYPNVTFRRRELTSLDEDVKREGFLGQPFFEMNGRLGYNFRTKELLLFR